MSLKKTGPVNSALFAAALSVSSPISAAEEIEVQPLGPSGWNSIWGHAVATGSGPRMVGPLTRIDVPREHASYLFTTPAHPAHPSIVRRSYREDDGKTVVETQAWSSGAPAAFKRWLKQIVAGDAPQAR
jgi:hypothetical protein